MPGLDVFERYIFRELQARLRYIDCLQPLPRFGNLEKYLYLFLVEEIKCPPWPKEGDLHLVGLYIFNHKLGRKRRIFDGRSEEHTSELQSLMRTSYAVFCL